MCSKFSSITFHRSPGMRNQVETQKERSQRTSIHENSMQYLLRRGGGSENNELQNICSKSNSITFYRCLGTSIQENSMHYLLREGV